MLTMHLARLVTHRVTAEPIALLVDEGSQRCVAVAIRPAQAEVIAQGAHPARTDDDRLTQDLVGDLATALGRALGHVEITALVEGRFRAEVVLDDGTRVSARPSDALALAVRDELEVRVATAVVEEVGQSFGALWGDRPPPPHEQVRDFRRRLDEVTADDFDTPGGLG